jgi:hypothetical protein
MKLSVDDVKLFYELLWALQFYVDQRLKIVATARSAKECSDYSQEQKFAIREALFSHPELITAYVTENPDKLTQEKLDIVQEWQYFVADDFYIERYLKGHAIFISKQVYGVLGLVDSFEDMYPKQYLPLYVKAILLPFKNTIVYDGLLQSYNIHFGSGIRKRLKEQYMKAKQQGTIIYSLGGKAAQLPVVAKTAPAKANTPNWQADLQELGRIASRLKGGGGQPSINSPIFALLKSSIELADNAVLPPQDRNALYQAIKKTNRALNQVKTAFNRMGDV